MANENRNQVDVERRISSPSTASGSKVASAWMHEVGKRRAASGSCPLAAFIHPCISVQLPREREEKLNFAKTLRSSLTEAEQRLWYYLRAHRFMGLKFKRQKPIGPFVADFICLELGLVIEVDGGQHGSASDARRDAWFKANGYHVLRFWNNDVLIQAEVVLESIRQAVIALSPTPLPQAGEGEDVR